MHSSVTAASIDSHEMFFPANDSYTFRNEFKKQNRINQAVCGE